MRLPQPQFPIGRTDAMPSKACMSPALSAAMKAGAIDSGPSSPPAACAAAGETAITAANAAAASILEDMVFSDDSWSSLKMHLRAIPSRTLATLGDLVAVLEKER